jgi:hypothetical protein
MLIIYAVMAGHSASEDARERAYVPAIHVFVGSRKKTWMPGSADKFTQSAQA